MRAFQRKLFTSNVVLASSFSKSSGTPALFNSRWGTLVYPATRDLTTFIKDNQDPRKTFSKTGRPCPGVLNRSTIRFFSEGNVSETPEEDAIPTAEQNFSTSKVRDPRHMPLEQQLSDMLASNQPDEIVKTVRMWKKGEIEGAPPFEPSLTTYNIFLLGAARSEQVNWKELIEWVEVMKSKYGLEPDTMTYNALLRHSARTSNAQAAEIAWGMLAASKVAPNATSYMNVIMALTDGGQPGKALQMLKTMHKEGMISGQTAGMDTRFMFQSVLGVLTRNRSVDYIIAALKFGQELGMSPAPWVMGEVLNVAHRGSHDQLALLVVQIVKETLEKKVHKFKNLCEGEILGLMDIAARTKNRELAESAWSLLPEEPEDKQISWQPPSKSLYIALIEARGRDGDLHGAFTLMNTLYKHFPKADKSWRVYTPLVQSLSQSPARVDEAHFTLVDIRQAGENVHAAALNTVLAASMLQGDMNRAFEMFVEAENELGVVPTVELYTTLMQACWMNAKPAVVHELYDEMKAKGLKPSAETHAQKVEACIIEKHFVSSFSTLNFMRHHGQMLPNETADRLMAALRREARYNNVKEWAIKLREWFGYEEVQSLKYYTNIGRFVGSCGDDVNDPLQQQGSLDEQVRVEVSPDVNDEDKSSAASISTIGTASENPVPETATIQNST